MRNVRHAVTVNRCRSYHADCGGRSVGSDGFYEDIRSVRQAREVPMFISTFTRKTVVGCDGY